MKSVVYIALLILGLIITGYSGASALPPEIYGGVEYLNTQQNTDGSWGNDGSSTGDFFSSTEVIESLSLFESTNNNLIIAIQWLNSQSIETTAETSLCLGTSNQNEQDFDQLISYLDIYAAAWGGHKFYGNNHLDTALALSALKKSGHNQDDIVFTIGRSADHLKEHQNDVGGWGFTADDGSDLYCLE